MNQFMYVSIIKASHFVGFNSGKTCQARRERLCLSSEGHDGP